LRLPEIFSSNFDKNKRWFFYYITPVFPLKLPENFLQIRPKRSFFHIYASVSSFFLELSSKIYLWPEKWMGPRTSLSGASRSFFTYIPPFFNTFSCFFRDNNVPNSENWGGGYIACPIQRKSGGNCSPCSHFPSRRTQL